jgi:AbiU2
VGRFGGLGRDDLMSPISWADRVRRIAATCYRDCDEAVGIMEFLQAGNTPEAEMAFGGEGHIAILLRNAMMQRLLMSTMRMHDKPGSDRENLRRAFELLAEDAVYLSVAANGDDARLKAAVAGWDLLSRDPALVALRNVRDFDVAHTIPSKAGEPRPLILELFRVAKETIKLTEDLAAGSGVCSVSFGAAHQNWARRAADYWVRLIRA